MATLEERLAEYEELFADRYTEKDECYQTHVATPAKPPPVITDWNANNYDRLSYLQEFLLRKPQKPKPSSLKETQPEGPMHQIERRRDNRGQGGRDGRGWDSRYGGDRDRRDDRYDRRDNRDNRGYGGGRQDYRDRGPRDNRYQTEYKSSDFYEMYY